VSVPCINIKQTGEYQASPTVREFVERASFRLEKILHKTDDAYGITQTTIHTKEKRQSVQNKLQALGHILSIKNPTVKYDVHVQ